MLGCIGCASAALNCRTRAPRMGCTQRTRACTTWRRSGSASYRRWWLSRGHGDAVPLFSVSQRDRVRKGWLPVPPAVDLTHAVRTTVLCWQRPRLRLQHGVTPHSTYERNEQLLRYYTLYCTSSLEGKRLRNVKQRGKGHRTASCAVLVLVLPSCTVPVPASCSSTCCAPATELLYVS